MDRPTISPEHIQEAAENLSTIRDFIRFGVTALRQYDAHLGQGTEDYFAESFSFGFTNFIFRLECGC